eukprot:jgi/Chlat1/8566/Chrsp82S07982
MRTANVPPEPQPGVATNHMRPLRAASVSFGHCLVGGGGRGSQARPGCLSAAPAALRSRRLPCHNAWARPAVSHKQHSWIVRCDADKQPKPTQGEVKEEQSPLDSSILDVAKELQDVTGGQKKRRKADSTDPISTALTRRFGLAGGLAWLGFLAFGVISEQIKTRREVKEAEEGAREVSAQQVTTPSGLKYKDLRIGGGDQPRKGDLVVVDYTGRLADGTVIDDTRARGRPVAFVFAGQPSSTISRGLEEGIGTMHQGGRRKIVIPPVLGFGQGDVVLPSGGRVPANSVLEYDVELLRVSIAP